MALILVQSDPHAAFLHPFNASDDVIFMGARWIRESVGRFCQLNTANFYALQSDVDALGLHGYVKNKNIRLLSDAQWVELTLKHQQIISY